MKEVTDRLRRVAGQISSLEASIGEDKSCVDVIPQLLAVKGAINGVLQTYLEKSLDGCIDTADEEKMKQLIKTLVKNS